MDVRRQAGTTTSRDEDKLGPIAGGNGPTAGGNGPTAGGNGKAQSPRPA
jgi:hypothetical protein